MGGLNQILLVWPIVTNPKSWHNIVFFFQHEKGCLVSDSSGLLTGFVIIIGLFWIPFLKIQSVLE